MLKSLLRTDLPLAKVLHRVVDQVACPYLPERNAAIETRVITEVTPRELEAMLRRGWRRFGPYYFRPRCTPCKECVPIRVPTAKFEMSRSQRRALKGAADLKFTIGVPRVDDERLDLYARWHAMREETSGWSPNPLDGDSYHIQFAHPHPAAREVAIYDGKKLIGIGIADQTPRAWSLVFQFYDPQMLDRSLGVVNVLVQLEHAKRLGIPYAYLGFLVRGCRSMEYKAGYRPHELLVGRPTAKAKPVWKPGESG